MGEWNKEAGIPGCTARHIQHTGRCVSTIWWNEGWFFFSCEFCTHLAVRLEQVLMSVTEPTAQTLSVSYLVHTEHVVCKCFPLCIWVYMCEAWTIHLVVVVVVMLQRQKVQIVNWKFEHDPMQKEQLEVAHMLHCEHSKHSLKKILQQIYRENVPSLKVEHITSELAGMRLLVAWVWERGRVVCMCMKGTWGQPQSC